MNILYLCSSLDRKDGWSRYSYDVITRIARTEHVAVFCQKRDGSVDLPQTPLLRSPLAYLFHPLWVLLDAWRVRRAVVRALRPGEETVVHCTVEGYAMFIPFLRGLSVRTVMTVHGTYSVLPLLSWKTRWLYRLVYRSVDRVVAVSGYTKRHLLRHAVGFLPEEKVLVMTNGVEYRERLRQRRNHDGVFRILTVGEVKSRKGGFHLVSVARVLRERCGFPFQVTFVGRYEEGRPYFEKLQSYIREYHLGGCVRFAGMVSQEELDGYYRDADVFVLLSVNEDGHYEGYPLVFHEAAMWGLPSVGTFDCGAEDAIKNGVTGVLVHPNEHDLIADAVANIRSGSLAISPDACRAWAQENDWGRKDLLVIYRF
jgi:glycosyltransferase involved in cell wall biosynthesis